MKYLKLMNYIPLSSASRNKREIRTAFDFGYKVTVLFSELDFKISDEFKNYELINGDFHPRLSSDIPKIKRYFIILKNLIDLILFIRKFDVISCHDLRMLRIGYLSTLTKIKKPKLIYDSHEYELERRNVSTNFQKWKVKHEEKYLMKKCAFSIMVNDSIADEVYKIHSLKTRPIVIRSVPSFWEINQSELNLKRSEFKRYFGAQDSEIICMYHGVINTYRGVEQCLRVTELNENINLIVLGYGSIDYLANLKKIVKKMKIEDRVMFHEAVDIKDLWKYVGAADVGLILIEPQCRSYYLSLPNKFFENIQSLTPIICSDFPEMTKYINKFDIGLVCDPYDIDGISIAIEKMRVDKKMYSHFKNNLLNAKKELSWENEKENLIRAYTMYLTK